MVSGKGFEPVIYTFIFFESRKSAKNTFHGLFHRKSNKGCEVIGDDGGVGLGDQGERASPRCICCRGGGLAHNEPRELTFLKNTITVLSLSKFSKPEEINAKISVLSIQIYVPGI